MIPRVPVLKRVQVVRASWNSEVIVIRPKSKAGVLKSANHGYELVIGCWKIRITVKHINRYEATLARHCSRMGGGDYGFAILADG